MNNIDDILERQNIFEESLTEIEYNILELFDFKNHLSSKIDGYVLMRLTKGGYNLKLMLGYNSNKNPTYTNVKSVETLEMFIKLEGILEKIITKANLSKVAKDVSELGRLLG